jgi:rhodanese-related sulfurtransferase
MTTAQRGKTFQQLVQEAKGRINAITVDDLMQWRHDGKTFNVVDVREPADVEAGMIPNAISIPRGILELVIDEAIPDQDDVIVLYCGGGSRSALAADTLQVMGYNKVVSLTGGWRAWQEANS